MKRKILIIVAVFLFIAGVSVFLLPHISNLFFHREADSKIEEFNKKYDALVPNKSDEKNNDKIDDIENYNYFSTITTTTTITKLDIEQLNQLYRDCYEYNEMLKNSQRELLVNAYSYKFPVIDLKKYGINNNIIGNIKIKSISLSLPILLGCNDETMAEGAAHMTYTSIPIGGMDTNTVLASHTAYSGRVLFDDLPQLKKGDEIEVTTFFSDLKYIVKNYQIVKKDNAKCLYIQKGRDLLTLMTCISDGDGGYNRYIVVCERV